ncbi:hypothetical protein DIPPA_05382 [Diplonema papillatum]|nr:hypothetical protein DIPPA_05382 [Diplonema papillatum]
MKDSPRRKRLRMFGEDEETAEGPAVDATAGRPEQDSHRHSFDASLKPRSKMGFACAICKEKRQGQLRRPCKGCDIFTCHRGSKC